MDPIEIEDWLAGSASLRYRQLTLRTSDVEEQRAFSTGLPTDYKWVEPDSELLQAMQASNAS